MLPVNWAEFPNFSPDEFRCRATGRVDMDPAYMRVLQAIRTEYGRPMVISSGFRDPKHPREASKASTSLGEHSLGRASDVLCHGGDALDLIRIALKHGIRRIGVAQKGPIEKRFVHLGLGGPGLVTPAIWTY